MHRTTRLTMNIIITLTVFTLVFFFLAPRLGGINLFTITSGSMSPAIPVGSVAIVQTVDTAAIKPGDIIAFRSGTTVDTVVTHRVIDIVTEDNSLGFHTAGDANASPDGNIVPAESVIGRTVIHIPGLGYLSSFANTKTGFILVIILPSLCIVLLEIKSILSEIAATRGFA